MVAVAEVMRLYKLVVTGAMWNSFLLQNKGARPGKLMDIVTKFAAPGLRKSQRSSCSWSDCHACQPFTIVVILRKVNCNAVGCWIVAFIQIEKVDVRLSVSAG